MKGCNDPVDASTEAGLVAKLTAERAQLCNECTIVDDHDSLDLVYSHAYQASVPACSSAECT